MLWISFASTPLHLASFTLTSMRRPSCPGSAYKTPRDNIALQLAVAVLSAGPIGIGDGPNCTNRTLVMVVCNKRGDLLHPSRAATPIDIMYSPAAAPSGQVWATHSAWPTITAWTVLAVDVDQGYNFTLDDLYPSSAFSTLVAYESSIIGTEPRPHAPQLMTKQEPLLLRTAAQQGVEHSFRVVTLSPLLPCGWAFLGEADKVVALSPQRVSTITMSPSHLTVSVVGIAGEATIFAFAYLARAGGNFSATLEVVSVPVSFIISGAPISIQCADNACKIL